jgi:hypothetical protein
MLLLPRLLRSSWLGQRGPFLILSLESPRKDDFLLTAIFGHNTRVGTLYPQHRACGPPEKPSDPLLTLVMAYT